MFISFLRVKSFARDKQNNMILTLVIDEYRMNIRAEVHKTYRSRHIED